MLGLRDLLARLGRGLALVLARVLLRPRGPVEIALIPSSFLVVRTDDRVGNVLLTTPLVAELRRAFPEARITFLVAARRRAVVEGWTAAELLPFDRRALWRPWSAWRLWRALRAARPDVAIEASHWHAPSVTSAILCRASGAPVVIAFDKKETRGLVTHAVPLPDPDLYDATAKLALLAPLGVRSSAFSLMTTLSADAGPFLAGLVPGRFVAVNVGGRKADHRLDAAGWSALLAELSARSDLHALLLWGPGEKTLAGEVARAAAGRARVAPPTNLAQLAAVFRAAALVVATDTGPMHLAVAVGAPTVGVFTKSDWRRWASPAPTFRAVSVAGQAWPAEAAQAGAELLAERG